MRPLGRAAHLIVAPSRRGSGLGATLCRLLIARAESFPEAESVRLFVYRDNAAAIRLYSKLDFIEAPSHTRAEFMAMQKSITRIER